MRVALATTWRIAKGLPFALLSPIFLIVATIALIITDAASRFRPRRASPTSTKPDTRSASIVIPNWNGADLLAKYLPSVIAAAEKCPGSEVIVVDNGSTDNSASFLLENFPNVRLIALNENAASDDPLMVQASRRILSQCLKELNAAAAQISDQLTSQHFSHVDFDLKAVTA